MTSRRILKELKDLENDPDCGITITPNNPSDLTQLTGSFPAPPDTPFTGGTYHVSIALPPTYPFAPPNIKFTTPIWHPNISSQTGAICLDTLGKKWTPVLTLKTALISLRCLLAAPEPDDPQDAEVAGMMKSDREGWWRKAREWAVRFAGAGEGEEGTGEGGVEERKWEVEERLVGMGFAREAVRGVLEGMGVKWGEELGEKRNMEAVERLLV